MKFSKIIALLFWLLFVIVYASPAQNSVKHIIVFGVDGLSPDGIIKANTPNIDKLISTGAHSFKARAVLPTISSPNWASMIMGAGPVHHGVTSNNWKFDNGELEPACRAKNGRFPSIFELIREQMPTEKTAVFHDWGGFKELIDASVISEVENTKGPEKTISEAADYLIKEKPVLTFLHLDNVDHAGHKHGYGTKEYYKAVEAADGELGRLIESLTNAGMFEETIILLTADHGGIGKGHGGTTLAEIEIPWIISGAGIKKDFQIFSAINTYDTAATIAYLLNLTPPDCWVGKPVKTVLLSESE